LEVVAVIAYVAKWGHSLALRIPSSFAREIHVVEGQKVDLAINGSSLVVTRAESDMRYDLAELVSAITDENRHGEISSSVAVGEEFA
jgi:antitoxin MazE